jgi:transposase-like protein
MHLEQRKKRGRVSTKDTPENMARLRAAAQTAESITTLARQFEVGPTTICRWLEKYSISTPKIKRMNTETFLHSPSRRLTEAETQMMARLRVEGWTFRRIARHIGCSVSSVYDALKRSGELSNQQQ